MEPGDTHGQDSPPGSCSASPANSHSLRGESESAAAVVLDPLQHSTSKEKDAEEELASEKCIREEL